MPMVQSFGPTNAELRATAERERLSEEADRAVIEMERRTRAALEYRQKPILGHTGDVYPSRCFAGTRGASNG